MKAIKSFGRRVLFMIYIQLHRYLHRVQILPYSRSFGVERGSPIGRYYVEKFLKENADSVFGCCLEFGQDRYRSYFPKATEYDITDVVMRPGVRYICDIHKPIGMPKNHFNSIICTQVFEHL